MSSKIRKVLALTLIVCLLLCGCGNKKEEKVETEKVEDKLEIGICFDSFLIERWERDRDVFVSTAKELGAEVNVQNANGSVDTQIAQIEYLIEKKVDVIVIICVDGKELAESVSKAKNQGIKVIAYDRMILDSNADLYISFDNEEVGRLMAEAIVASDSDCKKVLMLTGPTTDNNVKMVNDGFTKVMDAHKIKIVDTMHADAWKPEYASDYLYNHPDVLNEVDAIMCGNDSIASHTVRVLAEKRKAGAVLVTGQDAELEACQRIVENTQLMTVYKPVEIQAKTAAECAVAMAKGKELPVEKTTVSDGTYDIDGIVLDPIAVNKYNIDDTIVKSGFHPKDEVYLNVSGK